MKPFIYILFCSTFLFSCIPISAEEIHSVGILVDVSRSVSPREFERIRRKIQESIRQHTPSVHLELYIFGNDLQRISVEQLPSIEATQSNTIFYDALYNVLQDLEKETSGKKSIVIFSDGKDTRSAMILNDIVSRAREQKIVIHSVAIGKANHRLLERLAKLTGGKYFEAEDVALVQKIRNTIDVPSQSVRSAKESIPQKSVVPPATTRTSTSAGPIVNSVPYRWIAAIVGLMLVSVFFIFHLRHQKRTCPSCGKSLKPSQLVCSDCPGQTQIQPRPEIPASGSVPIPAAVPRKQQSSEETQELLSKTHYLDQTPSLVVTKGTNVGERYRMSKDHPISIGRSRLNEVRPDDLSISAQHCRIIPENGEYVIYDLGSTNGTVVNNIQVNMAVLEEGDIIRVGSTTLLFTVAGS